jgi:hypothetical protein
VVAARHNTARDVDGIGGEGGCRSLRILSEGSDERRRFVSMDFSEQVRELSLRVRDQLTFIQTEEATKNALIMPFISMLGYNVFNPLEVTPELHADVGIKKGEKVDYAILQDGRPVMLFECKWHGADLSKEHASQLYRYFSVTEARFGVLTNGIEYRFFTDLEAPNRMDAKPFFVFDLLAYRDHDLEEFKKFTKGTFDLDNILTTASELKYTSAIKRILDDELKQPSEAFVRFFTAQVYPGRVTPAVREQFAATTQRAFRQFVNERVNLRLQSALSAETHAEPGTVDGPPQNGAAEPAADEAKVVTTTAELEAFYTVKAILHADVSARRIFMRDVQSYCGVLLDNNNRKPLCRLYFTANRKAIGLFDGEGRTETRESISEVEDIYRFADRLRATLRHYEAVPTEVTHN